jgi:dynein heavy chain
MKEQKLTIVPHKKSGSFILQSLDEVQQVLDDQLNLMMMLKASPFMKTVQKQATALETKIILIQDTLENWIKCQRSWMYLEPIFGS